MSRHATGAVVTGEDGLDVAGEHDCACSQRLGAAFGAMMQTGGEAEALAFVEVALEVGGVEGAEAVVAGLDGRGLAWWRCVHGHMQQSGIHRVRRRLWGL